MTTLPDWRAIRAQLHRAKLDPYLTKKTKRGHSFIMTPGIEDDDLPGQAALVAKLEAFLKAEGLDGVCQIARTRSWTYGRYMGGGRVSSGYLQRNVCLRIPN